MGTNYYFERNICPHCHHPEERIHIGKSSAGWTFTFHGTDTIRSLADWRKLFDEPNSRIVDEYGAEQTVSQFLNWVESKRSEPRTHAVSYGDGSWLDDQGNGFSGHEFS